MRCIHFDFLAPKNVLWSGRVLHQALVLNFVKNVKSLNSKQDNLIIWKIKKSPPVKAPNKVFECACIYANNITFICCIFLNSYEYAKKVVYIDLLTISFQHRYAIGNVERPILKHKIGWLDSLANDIHEPYYSNNTGGPSIKVCYTKN